MHAVYVRKVNLKLDIFSLYPLIEHTLCCMMILLNATGGSLRLQQRANVVHISPEPILSKIAINANHNENKYRKSIVRHSYLRSCHRGMSGHSWKNLIPGAERSSSSGVNVGSEQKINDVNTSEEIPAAWENAIELLQRGDSFTSTISNVNKSGVLIPVGKLSGFIPYKLMNRNTLSSIKKESWTDELLGREITVKVTQVVVPERRLICSEKAVMLEQAAADLRKGDIVEGIISSLHNFGAFVEISAPEAYAGTEVILPLRELSWDWVANVGTVVTKGQKVKVKVVDVSSGPQCKVVVSLKRMEGDPLQENLDNVMPLDEDLRVEQSVPVAMPQGVEDILNELSSESGIEEVTLGRRVEERRTVSQDLELWMSKEQLADGFNLVARAGRVVQEIHVRTSMDSQSMKGAVQRVLKRVN